MAKLVAAVALMAGGVVLAWVCLTTVVVGWPVHAETSGIPLVVLYFVVGVITSDCTNPEIYLLITAMATGFFLFLGFVPGLPGHLGILALMAAGGVVGSFIVGLGGGALVIDRCLGEVATFRQQVARFDTASLGTAGPAEDRDDLPPDP